MLNGGSTGTITTGTFASRPAAGTAGNLYVDSTNFVWYYDNGTSWITLGPGPNPVLSGTASVTVPVGTTAQRPGSPTTGMLRFNSSLGMYEAYDTQWASIPFILDKSTTSVVQTSASSANLFSFLVPGGTLGTNGILRARLSGIWAVTGTARAITLTVSYGGSTMWSATSGTLGVGLTAAWDIELMLAANNSATSQTLTGRISIGAGLANGGTGIGTIGNGGTQATTNPSPWSQGPIAGTAAITSSSAQIFQVTCVASTATGTQSVVTCYYHTIEIL